MPLIQKMVLLRACGWSTTKIINKLGLEEAWAEPIFKSELFATLVEIQKKQIKE